MRGTLFGNVEDSLHRKRRGAANAFFSKASASGRMDVICKYVEKLCEILENAIGKDEVINFDHIYTALTMDVICVTALGKNYHYLENLNYAAHWKDAIITSSKSTAFGRHFPFLFRAVYKLQWSSR